MEPLLLRCSFLRVASVDRYEDRVLIMWRNWLVRRTIAMRRRWGLVALAVVGAALVVPDAAEGHAFLVRPTPQAGERLGAGPPSIELRFSEPVARPQQVAVKTVDGAAVESGPVQLVQNGVGIRAPLPSLADRVYVVSWQVLTDDGHVSLGEFAFAVGDAGRVPAQATQATAAAIWPSAAAGWLFLIGLLLAFGALASARFV